MNNDSAFWDRFADRYARAKIGNVDAYDATLERVRAHLKPGDRVLEIGCGTGTTALRLADAVSEYLATDYSPRMIAIAKAKPEGDALPGLRFEVAGAAEAGGAGPFDAVTAFNVLHLIPDLPGTLAHVHAALRPGGCSSRRRRALLTRRCPSVRRPSRR